MAKETYKLGRHGAKQAADYVADWFALAIVNDGLELYPSERLEKNQLIVSRQVYNEIKQLAEKHGGPPVL